MNKKLRITLGISGAFLLLSAAIATSIALSIKNVEESNRLDEKQAQLVLDLKKNKGDYDETSIVLENYSKSDLQYFIDKYDVEVRENYLHNFASLKLKDDTSVASIIEEKENKRFMDKLFINYHMNNFEVDEDETTLYYPNYSSTEPSYNKQSYLNYINIGDTWNVTLGKNEDGEKVKIAVIDSGIDIDHPEFFDADGNSIISEESYNAFEDQTVKQYGMEVIDDKSGHGTGVAGVIASQINGTGIMGIAPEAELIVIKATNGDNVLRASDVAFAIYYAIQKGANVINMSFGTTDPLTLAAPLSLAYDSDILLVAASGNDGEYDPKIYPACYDFVLGVGALAEDSFEKAEYSNYGVPADIFAPGTVYTTAVGGGYIKQNGTSFAAPIASAAAALYFSHTKYARIDTFLEDVFASSRDIGELGYDGTFHYGALDVNALVLEDKGYITFDPTTYGMDSTKVRYVVNHTIQKYPDEPTRANLIFNGWYFEKSYKTLLRENEYFTHVYTEDISLYAEWVNEDDNGAKAFTYKILDDNNIAITGYRGGHQLLTIPSSIDGYTVTEIYEKAFRGNNRIKVVEFPSTIQKIGPEAFRLCTLLKAIRFYGDDLTTIGNAAFSETGLVEVDIPDSVTNIGPNAFYACSALNKVNISENSSLETLGDYAFSGTRLSEFYIPEHSSFSGSVLANCYWMKKVTKHPNNLNYSIDGETYVVSNSTNTDLIYVPCSLLGTMEFSHTKICDAALEGSCLDKIIIHDVSYIGACAFKDSTIEEVNFGENSPLTFLGECSFENSMIKDIVIPAGVPSIEIKTFYRSALRSINFEEGSVCKIIKWIKEDPYGAFEKCYKLEEVNLPEGLLTIQNSAFKNCPSLTYMKLPSSLIAMDGYIFQACNYLETLDMSATHIGTIGEEICNSCFSLKTLLLPDTLVNIGPNAFANCFSLEHVDIPSSVSTIGIGAFYQNIKLKTIDWGTNPHIFNIKEGAFYLCHELDTLIPESVRKIEMNAFANTHLTSLYISKNLEELGYAAFAANYYLTSITSSEENLYFDAVDNCIYSKDHKQLWLVPSSRELSYTVLDGTETIQPYALAADVKLKHVTLPTGLIDIRFNAFDSCTALEEIYIPQSVEYIGRLAFASCSSLQELTFEENSRLSNIGFQAFGFNDIREVTIPSNVEDIAQYAFAYNEHLTTVTFDTNSKLKYLAAGIFIGCSSLTEINFLNGSQLEEIQAYGLSGMVALERVDFGDAHIQKVGNFAFYGDSSLQEVNIFNAYYVGRYAFYLCSSLRTIQLGDYIDYIGEFAFTNNEPIENRIAVYFKNRTLPEYLENYWDYGISRYYLNAKEFVSTDEYDYVVTYDDTIILTSYKKNDTDIVIDYIPSDNGNLLIDEIGASLFASRKDINSITIGQGVSKIGEYAFYQLNVKNIVIPSSVKSIGAHAFEESRCNVTLAEDSLLENIGDYAFYNAFGLEELYLPDNVTSIGDYAFRYSSITNFVVSEDSLLETIGEAAFMDTGITSLYVPGTVSLIDVDAFYGVTSLKEITFEESDTPLKLGHYSFYNNGITELHLPARLNYLGDSVFINCPELTRIDVNENNDSYKSIDGILFNYDGTRLLVYPAGRTDEDFVVSNTTLNLNFDAFYGQRYLKHVSFEEGSIISTIGVTTFGYCEALESIAIPNTVISIDRGAFIGCTNLSEVTFESGSVLRAVYESAFRDCTSLEEIALPNTVHEISYRAFYGCTSLRTIGIENDNNIMFLDAEAFKNSSLSSFKISKDLISIYSSTFDNTLLENIEVDSGNRYYVAYEGILFNKGAYGVDDISNIILWPTFNNYFYVIGEGLEEISAEDLTDIASDLYRVGNIEFASTIKMINEKTLTGMTYLHAVKFHDIELIESYAITGSNIARVCFEGEIGTLERYWNNGDYMVNEKKSGVYLHSLSQIEEANFTHVYSNILPFIKYIHLNGEKLDEIHVTNEHINDYAYAGIIIDDFYIEDSVKSFGVDVLLYNEIKNMHYLAKNAVAENDSLGRAREGYKEVESYSNGLTYLYNNNAYNQIYLVNLTIYGDENNTTFKERLMANSVRLENLVINNVKVIPHNAFNYSKLTNVTLNGVEEIGTDAFALGKFTSFTIPDSVTILGDAFSECDNLEEVTIGKGVKESYCVFNNLKTVNYNAENITNLTRPLFSYAYRDDVDTAYQFNVLGDVKVIPSNLTAWVKIYDGENDVEFSHIDFSKANKLESIEEEAFAGLIYLEEVNLPSNITHIGNNAFDAKFKTINRETIHHRIKKLSAPSISSYLKIEFDYPMMSIFEDQSLYIGNEKVTKLEVPSGTKEIKKYSFTYNEGLEEVYIPSSVTTIGDYAFFKAPNIEKLYIEGDVEFGTYSIGYDYKYMKVPVSYSKYLIDSKYNTNYKFNTEEIEFTGSGTLYDQTLFYALNLKKVVFDVAPTSIPYEFFYKCENLEEVIIPGNHKINYVGNYAFYQTPKLQGLSFDFSEAAYIGTDAFYDSGIEGKIYLSNTVELGDGAFYNTPNITEVYYDVPDHDDFVTPLFAKSGTEENPIKVTFGSHVKYVPSNLFYSDSDKDKSYVNEIDARLAMETLEDVGDNLFYANPVRKAYIPMSMLPYVNNYNLEELYILDGERLEKVLLGHNTLRVVELPSTLTYICDYAFGTLNKLTSISIPSGVNYIGEGAFYNTPITSITLPDGLEAINNSTFSNCGELVTVNVPSTVTHIGNEAFKYCYKLENISLPDEVTYIGDKAFYYCENVKDIIVPSSLTYLGESAYECCGGLKSIIVPMGLSEIKDYTFNSTDYTSLTIYHNITSIGDGAFWSKSDAVISIFSNMISNFGQYVFNDNKTTSTTIYGYKGSQVESWVESNKNYIFKQVTDEMHEALHHVGETHLTHEGDCTHPYEDGEVCSVCGYFTITTYVPAPGHKTIYYYRGMKVDCQHHPVKHDCYYCTTCEKWLLADEETEMEEDYYSMFFYLDQWGEHNYVWHVEKEATYEEDGLRRGECSVCHDVKEEVIPRLSHTHEYETNIINYVYPSCEEEGSYDEIKTCSGCGDEIRTHVIIPARGHTMRHYNGKTPTCRESGYLEYYECSACHKLFLDEEGHEEVTFDDIYLDYLPHTYGDWEITTAPTCRRTGIRTHYCTVCGGFETETVAKLDHDIHYYEEIPATCISTGRKAYYYCSSCGGIFLNEELTYETTESHLTIAITPHTYGDWITTDTPTCTEGGYHYHVCTYCNHEEGEELEPLGHTHSHYYYEVIEEPTCTMTGTMKVESICGTCHEVIEEHDETIQTVPHQLTYYPYLAPTCEVDGHIEYYCCSNCGQYFSDVEGHNYIYEITINKLYHHYEYETIKEATCQEGGIIQGTCTKCGDVKEINTSPTGHSMSRVGPKSANCYEDGWIEHFVCSHEPGHYYLDYNGNVEASYEDIVIKATHKYSYRSGYSSSCYYRGMIDHYYCSECGSYFIVMNNEYVKVNYDDLYLPYADHDYIHVDALDGGCINKSNYEYWYCANCDKRFMKNESGELYEVNYNDVYFTGGHHLVHYEATASSCFIQGVKEHYECSLCHKFFIDENGNTEISYYDLLLPYEHHYVEETRNYQSATCVTPEAYDIYTICSECGSVYSIQHVTGQRADHIFNDEDYEIITYPDVGVPLVMRSHCTVCCQEVTKEELLTGFILFRYQVNRLGEGVTLEEKRTEINRAIRALKAMSEEDKKDSQFENTYSRLVSYVNEYNDLASSLNEKDIEAHNDFSSIILGTSVASISLLGAGLHLLRKRCLF